MRPPERPTDQGKRQATTGGSSPSGASAPGGGSAPRGGSALIGVVWLNLGGPATTADLPAFLRSMLSDPTVVSAPAPLRWGISRFAATFRAPRVAHHYRRIGGGSPLYAESARQLAALNRELGPGFTSAIAFRHSPPRADAALTELARSGCKRLVAFPAYPQRSRGTTDSALADLRRAAAPLGLEVASCPSFPADELFIDALAAGVRTCLKRGERTPHLLFSSHGLPESALRRGDPYRDEVELTAAALAARFPELSSSLAFQSRLGPVAWTRPYLTDELRRLAADGVTSVIVAPLAFACENFETLYELDIEVAALAASLGITSFLRAPAPGKHPAFITCAARSIRRSAAAAGWLPSPPSPAPRTHHGHSPDFSTRQA
ncbi:MAG TPA: ferrochelatase [Planctomycetota bacterium]|nr:ferrochelatase [Planctomycetota bacterium]